MALILLSACADKKPVEANKATSAEQVFGIGDTVPLGDIKVMVKGVKSYENIDGALKNSKILVVSWDTGNDSLKPLPAADFPNMAIVDQNGTVYNFDEDWTNWAINQEPVITRKSSSDLNPGLVMSNRVAFELRGEYFDNSTWHLLTNDGVKIKICLKEHLKNGKCPKADL
ncbi:hypothetical protein ABI_08990 [Asticcacaulis biprosthecium C19]|uniref:Uncharacterized protein n=1 Tax=Asticcacaulis biprosthecium C19 TaxID=715226 RepID=F4QGD5_9CAUL|nr:hypothetical protein [Asticcacaulis biprosthecium]EGF92463.1 hypothetical protein ABI_08990 [Asticcacaulis biprosthecium C19]